MENIKTEVVTLFTERNKRLEKIKFWTPIRWLVVAIVVMGIWNGGVLVNIILGCLFLALINLRMRELEQRVFRDFVDELEYFAKYQEKNVRRDLSAGLKKVEEKNAQSIIKIGSPAGYHFNVLVVELACKTFVSKKRNLDRHLIPPNNPKYLSLTNDFYTFLMGDEWGTILSVWGLRDEVKKIKHFIGERYGVEVCDPCENEPVSMTA